MEPVTTHPSAVPAQMDSLFASSSRAGPVSDDIVAAASAEGQPDPPSLDESTREEDPQASRRLETLSTQQPEAEDKIVAGLPGLDDMPELASMKAATEVRQALGSPEVQAEHRAELADAPLSVHRSESGSPDRQPVTAQNVHDPASSSLAVELAATEEAASPASSSADAPGSNYDDIEEHDSLADPASAAVPQQEAPVPPPAQIAFSHTKGSEREHTATEAGEVTNPQQSLGEAENLEYLRVPDPTPIQLSQSAAADLGPAEESRAHIPESSKTEVQDSEGWSLRLKALLGEIEARSSAAAVLQGAPSQGPDPDTSTASSSKEPQTEDSSRPQNIALPTPLARPPEDVEGSSSKRQKLDDGVFASELAAFAPGSTARASHELPAPTTSTKLPARSKAAPQSKAPSKPKAAAKPKKEPKAKARRAVKPEELPHEEADPNPAVGSDVGGASTAEERGDPNSRAEQGAAFTAQEPEVKPKKARKTPAPTRKQPASAVEPPQEGIQTPPTLEQGRNTAPVAAGVAAIPADAQSTLLEHSAPDPATKGRPKGKAKPKPPSKAKGKAKAVPDDVAPSGMPVRPTSPSTTPKGPPPKPASKRTTAKKAKDPVAKLRPAQADGAVSELELEPTQSQQPAGASAIRAETSSIRDDATVSDTASQRGNMQSAQAGPSSAQGDTSLVGQHQSAMPPTPISSGYSGGYSNSNIFTSMPPPLYPAQAYYPTRAEITQQHNRGMSSLSDAATMMDSEMHWSESTIARPGSSSSGYEGVNEATSPTTVANTATGSVVGDAVSDATSLSPDQSLSTVELDPRIYPPGWRPPQFDLMDPDRLMTSMRERTVWTFWDCYLPLGCRDQDMVLLSNDGVAFPCAAWNPCLFSPMLKRVITSPNRAIRVILQRDVDENRKLLGYAPLPCIWIDENWHATNLLLSFLHPIPNMYLPDRATCRVVHDLGMRYGVERAITTATQRLSQLDEEDRTVRARGKGKARSTEEQIAADLAERAAEEMRD